MKGEIVAIVFIIALVATALAINSARNVSREREAFVLEFSVDFGKGEVFFENIGIINMESQGSVRLRAEVVSVEGLDRIVLNGKAFLKSDEAEYEILMPCIYSLNAECYRILMVIPGWDQPLRIKPGKYSLSVKLTWANAEGKGKVKLRIEPEITYASVEVISAKPESTEGWCIAEGSTRSYSMLTSKPETVGGKCVFKVWIWFFNRNVKETFLEITDTEGKQYIAEHVKLMEKGMYREVLLEISVPKGNTYIIKTHAGKTVLQQKIKC